MERIHARALETENRVRMLETDGMRLQLYQTMLTTVSTQAMLLLGFALATYGADLMPYIMNDTSPFCLFKAWPQMIVGSFFLLCGVCCICYCLLTIIASSILIVCSQNAYLHVGGSAAVWRTSQMSKYVYYWFGCALMCFLLDACLTMWIFIGQPHWIRTRVPSEDAGWEQPTDSVITRDGVELIRCLDPEDPASHAQRDAFGLFNAVTATLLYALFLLYGFIRLRGFTHQYEMDAVRGPDAVAREEHKVQEEQAARRAVKLAIEQRDEALAELHQCREDGGDDFAVGKCVREVDKASRGISNAQRRLDELSKPKAPRKVIRLPLRSPTKASTTGCGAARRCPPTSASVLGRAQNVRPVVATTKPVVRPPLKSILGGGSSARTPDDEQDSTA
jgi:hypothetical protein